MSYFARCRAIKGLLMGGVIVNKTSRFSQREDAEARMQQIIEIDAGNCVGEVIKSNLYPELFYHCLGADLQAINGVCSKCGKVLTVADAKEHAKLPLKGIQKS